MRLARFLSTLLLTTLLLAGSGLERASAANLFLSTTPDASGAFTSLPLTPNTSTTVYVISSGIPAASGLKGFEFSVSFGPDVTVLGTLFPGAGPINVGNPTNAIVGTGSCVPTGSVQVIATYTILYTGASPVSRTMTLGPTTPSSFSPAAPGWLACDNNLYTWTIGAPSAPIGNVIADA